MRRECCVAPGAVIAALTDLTFNVRGYAAVFANNLLTALFLVMIKRTSSKAGLTTTVPPPLPVLLLLPAGLACDP